MLGLSWAYWFACIGFFFAGFGATPAVTLHYSFINEFSCKIQIYK